MCTQILILQKYFCKDTETLNHYFMYSLVSILCGIDPLPAMHSLVVTLYVMEYLIGINQSVVNFDQVSGACSQNTFLGSFQPFLLILNLFQ